MIGIVKRKLLAAMVSGLKETACPRCGKIFDPRVGAEITSLKHRFICPHCGHGISLHNIMETPAESADDESKILDRPSGTRIERSEVSERELLFYIPPSGRWGGMLFFAILWNALVWPLFIACLTNSMDWESGPPPLLLVAIFPAAGLGLAIIAVCIRYAKFLLYLGPEKVRLQRQLFSLRRNFDLPTAEIETVRQSVFYTQNYQPVRGVEITAGRRSIKFGSALSEQEKKWLVQEIREWLRAHGPAFGTPPTAP